MHVKTTTEQNGTERNQIGMGRRTEPGAKVTEVRFRTKEMWREGVENTKDKRKENNGLEGKGFEARLGYRFVTCDCIA